VNSSAGSVAEEVVAEALARGLRSTDHWWQNQRITDDRKNAQPFPGPWRRRVRQDVVGDGARSSAGSSVRSGGLVCYSRGLAAYSQRVTAGWSRKEQPAYVRTFYGLGIDRWGAHPPVLGDDDSGYWEEDLPSSMIEIAGELPAGQRFDAIVVDEAQDFADRWWAAVLAALKDPKRGAVYIYSDEGQVSTVTCSASRAWNGGSLCWP
jgi:hypothetical protein